LIKYSTDMVISSCCRYYQLQLCIGPRGMLFGEEQSTIYANYGESSYKKVIKKSYHGQLSAMTW